MKKEKKRWQIIKCASLGILVLLVIFPVVYTVSNSFMSQEEVSRMYLGAVTGRGAVSLKLFPSKPTLQAYEEVLFYTPQYLLKFWRSIGMCICIAAGQSVMGSMCGMAFAKYQFRGRNLLFALFALFLVLPVQVTLLPNYIVLSGMHLTGTWWALILPAVSAPFSTFLMTLIFQAVPVELLEAARLDGAGTLRILAQIMIPVAKPGFVSLLVLVFVDNWNMVEQPMVFLEKTSQFPLSVFLANVSSQNFTLQFVCGVISLVPVTILFLFFHKELSEGITVLVSK